MMNHTSKDSHSSHDHNHASGPIGIVKDPVCGMDVGPLAGKPSVEHEGHSYHFCSDACRKCPSSYEMVQSAS